MLPEVADLQGFRPAGADFRVQGTYEDDRGGAMTEPSVAVLYASKSTEDVHGSIGTQIEDCRTMAQRQGWEIAGEFSDEAFSAYHGNRGPGLAKAKTLAVQVAADCGRCVLVAQDADRFARGAGDAPGAADHL